MTGSKTITFLGAGDCGPVHGPDDGFPIERYTELVRPTLSAVDIRLANCERQYSRRGTYETGAHAGWDHSHGRLPPEMAQIFSDCRFDAVTIANNHMYDYGPEALLDTRELLLSKGIQVTGGGRNLVEARQPAIVERQGVRVGFLGYTSVFSPESPATDRKPGLATIRVDTTYEGRGPHAPVRVRTKPNEDDLRMVLEDVGSLRKRVDVVIPIFHWGVVWAPRIISDYQQTIAHACIDAGADLILGHHAHIPKAIEVYKGKAIFYSLSQFCMTKAKASHHWNELPWQHGAIRNHVDLDPERPLLPYGTHSRMSLLAKATFSRKGVERVSFLPMNIDRSYRPEVLRNGDPRFDEMLAYMRWASEGFEAEFEVAGNEILVKT